MKIVTKKPVFRSLLSLSLLSSWLLIGGCNQANQDSTQTNDEVAELKSKLQDLEAENKTLKEQQDEIGLGSDPLKEAKPVSEVVSKAPEDTSDNAPVSEAETTKPAAVAFKDIADLPTQPLIADLIKLEILEAADDQNFQPYEPISRGEYMLWLFKAHNAISRPAQKIRLAPTFDPEFTDIDAKHPAFKVVQALANAGYSVGYDDKTFKPDQPITREEMISIKVGIDKGKSIKPVSTSSLRAAWKFSDIAEIDKRHSGYIYNDLFTKGPQGSNIERAFGKIGTFKPKQAAKRHEAAATLWQIGRETAPKALERKEKELS
ncbi:S-layer homology domain-containing protein [Acaryochloris sp. CCMEE 5410]|uniref:S-layer homology domain-containing protein n=1 Tax=Acaryochloris sp. CCMEE 5410 TaxID=310037 RepID=UPI0002483EAA|nr:S-layer homology domain-containing protein [Acaryochloris sp. CCMEE 5410]KAI9133913.1 S-layer homology domain-containing protein [Acaryochloris sp. CCMEE 5410]